MTAVAFRTTEIVTLDIRNTLHERGAKGATAEAWGVGVNAIRPVHDIIAHEAGRFVQRFWSESGGVEVARKRHFPDLVEVDRGDCPDDLTPYIGRGRASRIRRFKREPW